MNSKGGQKSPPGGRSERKVKNKAQDARLSDNSELRKYLAGKQETGVAAHLPGASKFIRAGKAATRPLQVLLVVPPMCLFEGAVKRVIPPLGPCYVAAAIELAGHHVSILDCIGKGIKHEKQIAEGVWSFGLSPESFRSELARERYDVVGFSMVYSSDLRNLYEYAAIARETQPWSTIVAGGLHASIYAERFLRAAVVEGRPVVDYVIRGEGEVRMVQLLNNLAKGRVDLNADGLAGWNKGKVFCNPQYSTIANLDGLPLPAYHLLEMETYFDWNVPFSPYPRGNRVMQLLTSRGCPVGCTFCASTNFSKAYRTRSVDVVMAEVRTHIANYAIDELQFADDNLTFNRARSLELFAALEKVALPWCTPNGIMVNTLDNELIDAMADSGLYQITLSIDSGSETTLKKQHRKPVTLSRIPSLVERLRNRGVSIHATLVVGMPGETEEAILEGFAYVESLPLNSINVFLAQAIPGSELFENALQDGSITYEEALHIDSARAGMRLSAIPPDRLEALVADFLDRYNRLIYQRSPTEWHDKYDRHLSRMGSLCIGNPSAITSSILNVGSCASG